MEVTLVMGIIKLKRGNSADFTNVVLQVGEPAFVIDEGKLYIGDGSNKILINPDMAENAETASRLNIPRNISITGDVTASGVAFDGSKDIALPTVLKNVGTSGTYTKVTTDAKGRVTSGTSLTINDLPTIPTTKISGLGTVADKNTGTVEGSIPILGTGGKLDNSVIPAIAITNTFVVDREIDMLALDVQVGDVAIRTDVAKSFILRESPPTQIANWQELLSPPNAVLSVNGKTGVVTITKTDVSLGNVTNESKATMFSSPVFTGTPTAPTPSTATNTTQIATTAFVKAQGYLTSLPPHNHHELYEPIFTKGTAFNKNFGTTSGTVAEGNHTHAQYLTSSSVIDGGTF